MGKEIILYRGPEIEPVGGPDQRYPLTIRRGSHLVPGETSSQDNFFGQDFLDTIRKVKEILGRRTKIREDAHLPLVQAESQTERRETPSPLSVRSKAEEKPVVPLKKEAIISPKSFSFQPLTPPTFEMRPLGDNTLKPISLRPEERLNTPAPLGQERSGTIFSRLQGPFAEGQKGFAIKGFEETQGLTVNGNKDLKSPLETENHFKPKPLVSFRAPSDGQLVAPDFRPTGLPTPKSDIIVQPAPDSPLMRRKEALEPQILNPRPLEPKPLVHKGLSITSLQGRLNALLKGKPEASMVKSSRGLTRRDFFKISGVVGVGLAIASCTKDGTTLATPLPGTIEPTGAPTATFAIEATPTTLWEGYPAPVNPPEFIPEAGGGPFPESLYELAAHDRYLALETLARQEGETFLVATEEEYRRILDEFAQRRNLEVEQIWNEKFYDSYQMVSVIVHTNPDGIQFVYWFATPGGALSARPDIPSEEESALAPVPLPDGTHPGWRWGEDGNIYMYQVDNDTGEANLWFNTTIADAQIEGGLVNAYEFLPGHEVQGEWRTEVIGSHGTSLRLAIDREVRERDEVSLHEIRFVDVNTLEDYFGSQEGFIEARDAPDSEWWAALVWEGFPEGRAADLLEGAFLRAVFERGREVGLFSGLSFEGYVLAVEEAHQSGNSSRVSVPLTEGRAIDPTKPVTFAFIDPDVLDDTGRLRRIGSSSEEWVDYVYSLEGPRVGTQIPGHDPLGQWKRNRWEIGFDNQGGVVFAWILDEQYYRIGFNVTRRENYPALIGGVLTEGIECMLLSIQRDEFLTSGFVMDLRPCRGFDFIRDSLDIPLGLNDQGNMMRYPSLFPFSPNF